MARGSYTPPSDNLSHDGLIAERVRLEFLTASFTDKQPLEDEAAFADLIYTLKHES
ncbi:MAG: hypothetical protein ACI84O_001002 [Myxococcota bacterium]|jgi:hypothetical protein